LNTVFSRPCKAAIGLDYKAFEAKLEAAVHLRFGLPAVPPAPLKTLIKRADRACAYFEATQLAGFETAEARKFFGVPRGVSPITLKTMTATQAQRAYIERFDALMKACDHGR